MRRTSPNGLQSLHGVETRRIVRERNEILECRIFVRRENKKIIAACK